MHCSVAKGVVFSAFRGHTVHGNIGGGGGEEEEKSVLHQLTKCLSETLNVTHVEKCVSI